MKNKPIIIKESFNQIKSRINQYHLKSEPIIKVLSHLHNLKTPKIIFDKKTGDLNVTYENDSPQEIELKKYLEELAEKYLY